MNARESMFAAQETEADAILKRHLPSRCTPEQRVYAAMARKGFEEGRITAEEFGLVCDLVRQKLIKSETVVERFICEKTWADHRHADGSQIGMDERDFFLELAEWMTSRHLEAGYPFAAEAAGRLRSVLEELKDLGASAAAQSERLDADPERLQKIGDRLNTIYSLCQKHRAADLGELLAKQTDYEARLQAITHGDEAIAAVATELTATEEKAEELARNIHATREKAAPTFNDAIQTTLARLGMPEARFVVQLTPAPALTPTGDDEIDFLFTANGNFAPQKVERIASGGEISRVMLALKALLAHRMELPTIIFDEIDTGVSGRIADAMGEIIADLSQTMQVVDITHLPQVASKGDTHFVVYKDAEGSHIRRLDPEERITEIAKMLSGSQITEAALAQARILLKP